MNYYAVSVHVTHCTVVHDVAPYGDVAYHDTVYLMAESVEQAEDLALAYLADRSGEYGDIETVELLED